MATFSTSKSFERDDSVDGDGFRKIAHPLKHVGQVPYVLLVLHIEDVVQLVERPVGFVFQAQRGQQEYLAALALQFHERLVALLITRQAQKAKW